MAKTNFLTVEPKTISENWVTPINVPTLTDKVETLSEKLERLGNLDAGYKFRLGAILASDNNAGVYLA